jgi:hypothetical protein
MKLLFIYLFFVGLAFGGIGPGGDWHWKSPVTSSTLPATGNALGDARETTDNNSIYVWSGTEWVEVGSSTPVTPGGSSGDIQYNNMGSFGGDTATTDGSGNMSVTSLTASGLTASELVCTNGSKTLASASVSSPLTFSASALGCQAASGSQAGCLSSTDWTTFNNKQASGSYITALTGDVTASGPESSAATLATVNNSPGSYTYASLTVNGKGLVTAASSGTAPTTYTFADSVSNSGGTVTLKNDSSSPSNSNYYGTNSSGTLGFFSLPTGITTPGTTVSGDVVTWSGTTGSALLDSGINISGNNIVMPGLNSSAGYISYPSLTTNTTQTLINWGNGNIQLARQSSTDTYLLTNLNTGSQSRFRWFANANVAFENQPSAGGFYVYDSTGSVGIYLYASASQNKIQFDYPLEMGINGNNGFVFNITTHDHLKLLGDGVVTAAANANAGSSATCTIAHDGDLSGQVTLTPGGTGITTGAQCAITFNETYGVAPLCHLEATEANSAAAGNSNQLYVTSSTSLFTINAGVGLTTGLAYTWNYLCFEPRN